jgi:hypothetical protein
MSNGSGGPHGVALDYENIHFVATDDVPYLTVTVKLADGTMVTTKISRKTGQVVS